MVHVTRSMTVETDIIQTMCSIIMTIGVVITTYVAVRTYRLAMNGVEALENRLNQFMAQFDVVQQISDIVATHTVTVMRQMREMPATWPAESTPSTLPESARVSAATPSAICFIITAVRAIITAILVAIGTVVAVWAFYLARSGVESLETRVNLLVARFNKFEYILKVVETHTVAVLRQQPLQEVSNIVALRTVTVV